jgi:hypothetical protein
MQGNRALAQAAGKPCWSKRGFEAGRGFARLRALARGADAAVSGSGSGDDEHA